MPRWVSFNGWSAPRRRVYCTTGASSRRSIAPTTMLATSMAAWIREKAPGRAGHRAALQPRRAYRLAARDVLSRGGAPGQPARSHPGRVAHAPFSSSPGSALSDRENAAQRASLPKRSPCLAASTSIRSIYRSTTACGWPSGALPKSGALGQEPQRLAALQRAADWENPGPGGFYDDLGSPSAHPHLMADFDALADPEFPVRIR